MQWIKYCNSNSYACLANLMDKILHLFPKSVSFNGFAKASEPNKWNKGHLKEGNGEAPLGQMFSQFIDNRINTSFLKGTCFYCFLVHLPWEENCYKLLQKASSISKSYIARKQTCLTLNKFTALPTPPSGRPLSSFISSISSSREDTGMKVPVASAMQLSIFTHLSRTGK